MDKKKVNKKTPVIMVLGVILAALLLSLGVVLIIRAINVGNKTKEVAISSDIENVDEYIDGSSLADSDTVLTELEEVRVYLEELESAVNDSTLSINTLTKNKEIDEDKMEPIMGKLTELSSRVEKTKKDISLMLEGISSSEMNDLNIILGGFIKITQETDRIREEIAMTLSEIQRAGDSNSEKLNAIAEKMQIALNTSSNEFKEKIETATRIIEGKLAATSTEMENQIEATTTELGNQIGATTAEIGNQIGATITELGNQIGATTTELGNQIGTTTTEIGNQIGATTTELGNQIGATAIDLGNKIGITTDTLGKLIETTMNELGDMIETNVEILGNKVETTSDSLKNKIDVTSSELVNNIDTMAENIKNQITSIENKQKDYTDRFDSIDASLKQVFQFVSNGKKMLAAAITDKKVEVPSDIAAFEVYCELIRKIGANSKAVDAQKILEGTVVYDGLNNKYISGNMKNRGYQNDFCPDYAEQKYYDAGYYPNGWLVDTHAAYQKGYVDGKAEIYNAYVTYTYHEHKTGDGQKHEASFHSTVESGCFTNPHEVVIGSETKTDYCPGAFVNNPNMIDVGNGAFEKYASCNVCGKVGGYGDGCDNQIEYTEYQYGVDYYTCSCGKTDYQTAGENATIIGASFSFE